MDDVCIAFKAHLGWVNAVAVRTGTEQPEPVLVERVRLVSGNDREASEPYHVAGGWSGLRQGPRPPDPAAVIRRGRRKQSAAARARLQAFCGELEKAGYRWRRGVVLTARGRMDDDLEHMLGSHARIHVAEGEAIRDATRSALRKLSIEAVDQDEKRILHEAERLLRCRNCDGWMKSRRPPGTRSWTKEDRIIALGAWLQAREP